MRTSTRSEPGFFSTPYFWISLAVLVTAAAVGVLIWVGDQPFYAVALAALPLGALALFRVQQRLFLAPVLIFFTAAYTRFYIGTGTQSNVVDSFILTMLFVGLWVLRELIANKGFRLAPFPINAPLIGFMIVVWFSIVWSIIFRDPTVVFWDTFIYVQLATATVMVMLPALMLLIGNHIRDLRVLKVLVVMMLITGVLGLAWDEGWINLQVETGGLFTMWIVGLSVGLAVFNKKIPIIGRVLLLALAGAWIFYRFGLNITWVAGWLPPFVVLFVLAFMRDRRFLIVMILILAVVLVAGQDYYKGVLEAEQSESGNTRISAWIRNLQIYKDHLLFGTGPGGYVPYLMTYYPKGAMASHSNYIDILAETGIVGLFFYLWFFVRMAFMGYRVSARARGRGDFIEAMANVAFAGTVGAMFSMFLGDWLIPFPYTQGINAYDYISYSWIFMGFILVLDRLTREKAAAAEQAGSEELNASSYHRDEQETAGVPS